MADANVPLRKSRTLVLCFDGTDNQYDADNTNVVKLFALLKRDDIDEQLCYYQPGVGTWFQPGMVSPFLQWAAKILDIAFATYMDAHVLDGYKYVMQNYRAGDKICIFGFSRGAYTARAVAGFLFKVGLLPKDNDAQVDLAYKLYKRTDQKGLKLCAGFKQTYCQNVSIDFMGVWDTVASVGIMMGRVLPFTTANNSIKIFRHALSLDEHRAKFRPNNYYTFSTSQQDAQINPTKQNSNPSPSTQKTAGPESGSVQPYNVRETGKSFAPQLAENVLPNDILEVWFAGCHGDVGGGYVSNETEANLANISLRWMVHEVMKSNCGVKFSREALDRITIHHGPEACKEEIEFDKNDALKSMHDSLKRQPLWWLLEMVPLRYTYQNPDGTRHRDFGIHLGLGRKIVEEQPKFHPSVKVRMDSQLKYSPRARWKRGTEVYIQ